MLVIFLTGAIFSMGVVYALKPAEVLKNFPDADYNDYYGDALQKMYGRGIIFGDTYGNFNPNKPVTRAELVAILERYDDSFLDRTDTGNAAKLVDLICDGFEKEDFQYKQDLYEEICETVTPL